MDFGIDSILLNANKKKRKLNFQQAYSYWKRLLFSRCIKMFDWIGLPDTIPQKEIESYLIALGFCGIVDTKKSGLIAVECSLHGVTSYQDEFTHMTYATPLDSGMAKVNKTAVVVDNTSTRMPLTPLIERYSILLAHADLSLQAVAINTRSTGMAVVSTQAEADSVKAYYSALEQGATMAVLESTNMNSLADMQGMRVLSNVYPSSTSIKDFYSLQQNLLKSFYNDIGVRMSTDKRERLISDEVNSDEEMLLFNIDDALKCRQAACEKMNKLYGLNVSVRHAVDFSMSKNQEQEKQKEGDEDVK